MRAIGGSILALLMMLAENAVAAPLPSPLDGDWEVLLPPPPLPESAPEFSALLAEGQLGASHAQYRLGYLTGSAHAYRFGYRPDASVALGWLSTVEGREAPEAAALMGFLRLSGEGLAADPAQALAHFQAAAAAHVPVGEYMVARMTEHGLGTSQDPKRAAELYRHSATHDDMRSQFALGSLYRDGRGVSRSLPEAKRWYGLAASQGYAPAQVALGDLLVRESGGQALAWYRAAAVARDPVALMRLGALYAEGSVVTRDQTKATACLRRAGELGDAAVRAEVAGWFLRGRGISRDAALARRLLEEAGLEDTPWLQLRFGAMLAEPPATEPDRIEAYTWLARAWFGGAEAAHPALVALFPRLAPEAREEALQRVGAYYENNLPKAIEAQFRMTHRAAQLGVLKAQLRLAVLYQGGKDGIAKDEEKARGWYRIAAATGNVTAMERLADDALRRQRDVAEGLFWLDRAAAVDAGAANTLANYYLSGSHGIPEDPQQALRWYSSAAKRGNTYAQEALGRLYSDGKHVAYDPQKALAWMTRAAEAGDVNAMRRLASWYREWDAIPRDVARGLMWLERAADRHNGTAIRELAETYEFGRDVPIDLDKAIAWYRLAAEGGDPRGSRRLGAFYEAGRGLNRDLSLAYMHYRVGEARGSHKARKRLAELLPKLSASQRTLGQHHFARWVLSHERCGFSKDVMTEVYRIVRLPVLTPEVARAETPRERFKRLKVLALFGSSRAMSQLGWAYGQGEGVEREPAQARLWYEKAAAGGDRIAIRNLASLSASEAKDSEALVRAYMWWLLAEERQPFRHLARMSAAEQAEAVQAAERWRKQHPEPPDCRGVMSD